MPVEIPIPLFLFALLVVLVLMYMAQRRTKSGMEGREREVPRGGQAGRSTSVPRTAEPAGSASLAGVNSWGYQLQKLNVARAAASDYDLLVIDYSRDGSQEGALKPAELDRLKRKPDGSRRIVLAYISVGEAESYRYYWNRGWKKDKPSWLLGENPEWEENYAVCFWEPGWQSLICGGPDAYLDRVIAAGFDGVYLDKCDVFEDLERHYRKVAKARPDMAGDMVGFVARLSRYAKSRAPGFVVVMQNAEPLLASDNLRAAIDGVAKEELIFGQDAPEKRNSKDDFNASRRMLDIAKSAGKRILVVEYLADARKIAEAAQAADELGYVLYVAPKDRELDRLSEPTLWA